MNSKYDYRYYVWKKEVHGIIMLLPVLVCAILLDTIFSNEINSPRFSLAIVLLVAGLQQGWMMLVNHYTCFSQGRKKLIVSNSSISQFKTGQNKVEILWKDISSIKYIFWLQRLEIYERTGRRISIGYQIQNFSALEEQIIEQTSQFEIIPSKVTRFSKNLWVQFEQLIGLSTLFVVCLNIYFHPTAIWFDSFIYIFSIVVAWGVVSSVRSVVIEANHLILNKLLWKTVVELNDVNIIEYCDRYSDTKFSNEPYVLLEVVKKGEEPSKIELGGFKEGLLSLGESLKNFRMVNSIPNQ